MPGSAMEGKELVRDFCLKNNVRTFLDIGAGEGTYWNAFTGHSFYQGWPEIPIDQIDAVEAWGGQKASGEDRMQIIRIDSIA